LKLKEELRRMSLFRITTNVSALTARRNLRRADNRLAGARERLSSGLRINSAADDAAGLAISEKNTTQTRGLRRASTNAQDGISVIQTADGGLEETQNSLQRMRELAVQASNDTLVKSDREQIQSEVDALAKEIQRISEQTQFNTKSLLDGSQRDFQLQVGANEGQSIEFSIENMGTADEGLSVAGDGVIKSEQIENPIVGVFQGDGNADTGNDAKLEVVKQSDGTKALELRESVELVSGNGEILRGTVIATQNDTFPRTFDTVAVGGLSGDPAAIESNVQLKPGSVFTLDDIGTPDGDFKTAKQNNTLTDLTAEDVDLVNFNTRLESGDYSLRIRPEGAVFTDSVMQLLEDGDVVARQSMAALPNGLIDFEGNRVARLNDDQLEIDGGTTMGNGNNKVEEEFAYTATEGKQITIGGPDVTQTDDAEEAIGQMDQALGEVSDQRSDLGALENRLEKTISVNDITTRNLQAARSRIRDADIARESVVRGRSQIVLQAGASVLAQANLNPQSALQLLGG
jgi:flagellin